MLDGTAFAIPKTVGPPREDHRVTSSTIRITAVPLLAALSACIFMMPPESRPASFVGKAGAPLPDGCPVADQLAVRAPPFPVEEIATISAVAYTKDQCTAYLVRHEACHYGGDVIYGLEAGESRVGQETPTSWCSARLARRVAQSPAAR